MRVTGLELLGCQTQSTLLGQVVRHRHFTYTPHKSAHTLTHGRRKISVWTPSTQKVVFTNCRHRISKSGDNKIM
jgi:hypothetical protein